MGLIRIPYKYEGGKCQMILGEDPKHVLVSVLVLVLARRPEAASGSHLDAKVGNRSFSLQKLGFWQKRSKNDMSFDVFTQK